MADQNVPARPSKRRRPTKKAARLDIFTFTPASIIQPPSATALASFITVSSDGRCQHQTIEEIEAPLETPLDDFNNNFDYPENKYKPPFPFADLLEKEVEEEIRSDGRSRRYLSSVSTSILFLDSPALTMYSHQDEPLKQWTSESRSEDLNEILQWEGRGEFREPVCPICKDQGAVGSWRCQECLGGELICDKCCVQMHAYHPLHNIEVSIGYFSLTTLVLTKTSAG